MKLVKGAQSIAYDRAPYLISSASVVGKKEGAGPIGEMFDLVGESDLFGENTWEEAESTMQREACLLAMGKAHVSQNQVRYLFGGDLLRQGIVIIFAGCLASFLIIEGLIISQMHVAGPDNLDYLIVLGAQVYKNGPSPVLKFRLDKAYEYLSANPETRCIVTGGQGSNEPFTEASCMADYLVKRGIDSGRIILEDKSTTTAQNLTNSMKLISADTINHALDSNTTNTVGILTNDFHMFRAMQIARAQKIPNAYGISCGSTKVYLPNNMFREYFAEIKFLLKQLTKHFQ